MKYTFGKNQNPANTQRRNNVAAMSRHCSDVVTTLLLRCVFAGKALLIFQIKMSFVKNNREEAFIVFNGFGKDKTSWFTCNNILYASYNDLPDAYIADKELCPGT